MANLSDKHESDEFKWFETLVVPHQFTKEEYEYSADRRALAVFHAIPGAGWLQRRFINFFLKFEVADLLGTAVKVSEKQFPQVHSIVQKISNVLGIEPPPVYLKESPDLNAWTFGTDEKNVYVVVTRGLIDAARSRELAFFLGHELGHIKSEHVLYHTVAHWLAGSLIGELSVQIPGAGVLRFNPALIALLAWHRRAEITADRAGLICCQDLAAAQRALALGGLGSRGLADQINIEEFEDQAPKDYGRWKEILQVHPYLPKRLKGIRLFSKSHFYLRRILQEEHTAFLPPEDLDTAMGRILGDKDIAQQGLRTESSDERRLKAMMAFAAAWEDGTLSGEERQLIEALMGELEFATEEKKSLSRFFDEALEQEDLEKELRYFKGNKLVGLAYAFSVLTAGTEKPRRSQRSFLVRVSKACGVPDDKAKKLVSSVGYRKAFFAEHCGLHLCANCSKAYAVQQQRCPDCGVLASSLVRLTPQPKRRICGQCGVAFLSSDFDSCPRCGSRELLIEKGAAPLA